MTKTAFFLSLIVSIIVSSIFGFLAGSLAPTVPSPVAGLINRTGAASEGAAADRQAIATEDGAIVDVVKQATPSVVSIVVTKDVPRVRRFFNSPFDLFFEAPFDDAPGAETERRQVGGGTGFFVSGDGLIVTNRHVVDDPSAEYTIITSTGTEHPAEVLARDTVQDFAVLRIDDGSDYAALSLGDSESVEIGQTVIAIGNSLGEFANTVSRGIVSGLQRDIVAGSFFGDAEQLTNIIQTDAAINPGNSGGPLLDINGAVIGINTAVAQGAENVGFAIPINEVRTMIQQVRDTGRIARPFMGVRYMLIDERLAQELEDFPFDHGALLLRGERRTDFAVIPGSPADKAGLRENDVILAINGNRITPQQPLAQTLARAKIGDTVTLRVWSSGEITEVDVVLEERGTEE